MLKKVKTFNKSSVLSQPVTTNTEACAKHVTKLRVTDPHIKTTRECKRVRRTI